MTNEVSLYDGGGGLSRDSRRAARAISRSKSMTQLRQARIVDEADVTMEKMEQATYLTTTGLLAIHKVAQAVKQLEEQSGGDMSESNRLNRFADRHEWICGEAIEDFRRDVRKK